ncbi:hypothetical protein FHR84_003721 [Actinopolyspora biskrensis]|uniref:Uncharacterized protein n=1 Tax=Actinopolyspora biskrensis TaxID=1470178 RepID=A0A852YZ71_9ACTN|nr:hypothetical protein [Actinopolyspora biskrensis]NYH80364.1 hypothetical protein [Actinopolyspora biskrensis]
MDDEELRRRFHRPTARGDELEKLKRQKIERGEIAKSVSYDPTQAIGLDKNLDPFPLTSDTPDKPTDTTGESHEDEDTDENR